MKKKKHKSNPHCPVPGCRTKQPHDADPIVKALSTQFSSPEKMTAAVLGAMANLGMSICRDYTQQNFFAWHTRLRQPEELYIRTLYALFIADKKELPHILSGDPPNSLMALYKKVNPIVFEGRGMLDVDQPGLIQGSFTPMDMLHEGAHVSFRAIMTSISAARHPENLLSPDEYCKHLEKYCVYLKYMHDMFKAGKEKQHVLDGIINLHRPASYHQAKAAEAEAATKTS